VHDRFEFSVFRGSIIARKHQHVDTHVELLQKRAEIRVKVRVRASHNVTLRSKKNKKYEEARVCRNPRILFHLLLIRYDEKAVRLLRQMEAVLE
jgi:hypothetical protein